MTGWPDDYWWAQRVADAEYELLQCRYCRSELQDDQEIRWRMCLACYDAGRQG